jgi:hypothetical protein
MMRFEYRGILYLPIIAEGLTSHSTGNRRIELRQSLPGVEKNPREIMTKFYAYTEDGRSAIVLSAKINRYGQ